MTAKQICDENERLLWRDRLDDSLKLISYTAPVESLLLLATANRSKRPLSSLERGVSVWTKADVLLG